MKRPTAALLLVIATGALWAGGAGACGYHPGLTDTAFEVVHPRSLSVAVALRRAQEDGVLEVGPEPAALPGFPGEGYRRAVRQLQGLAAGISRAEPAVDKAGESWRFAFVFVRSRLWAQFRVGPDGAGIEIHTPPAGAGESVVLSDESVLNAIAEGRLTFAAAKERGLIQFADDCDGRTARLLGAALGRAPVKVCAGAGGAGCPSQ